MAISMLLLYVTPRLISIRRGWGGGGRAGVWSQAAVVALFHQHALTPALLNALLHFINGRRATNISAAAAHWTACRTACTAGRKGERNYNSQDALPRHVGRPAVAWHADPPLRPPSPQPPRPTLSPFYGFFHPRRHTSTSISACQRESWLIFSLILLQKRLTTWGGRKYCNGPNIQIRPCSKSRTLLLLSRTLKGVVKTAANTEPWSSHAHAEHRLCFCNYAPRHYHHHHHLLWMK